MLPLGTQQRISLKMEAIQISALPSLLFKTFCLPPSQTPSRPRLSCVTCCGAHQTPRRIRWAAVPGFTAPRASVHSDILMLFQDAKVGSPFQKSLCQRRWERLPEPSQDLQKLNDSPTQIPRVGGHSGRGS